MSGDDRAYVSRGGRAAARAGQQEAEQRVNQVITQAKAAVDESRKAALKLALWMTAALFMGAFAASLAATEGGGLRDGTWLKSRY